MSSKRSTKGLEKSVLRAVKLAIKIHSRKFGNKCAYCGAYADTIDHIVPVSFFGERENDKIIQYKQGNLVRACGECNSIASNKVFNNFWEKKQYIANAIAEKYWNLVVSPEWSEKEIDEIEGYTLKSFIKGGQQMKDFIRARIENLNTPEIYNE